MQKTNPNKNDILSQDVSLGGLISRGVAFMAVFDGFGEHFALLLFVLQNTGQRGKCGGGFRHDAYPPELNPPFPTS